MLKEREKAIVQLLIHQDKTITTEYIALMLHVSSRTIKSDIKNINQKLKSENIQIQTLRGKGVFLVVDENKKGYLYNLIGSVDATTNQFTDNFRKYEIIKYLLGQNNYITIAEVCESMYFSRSVITNELDIVAKELEKHQLKLLRNNLGLFVSGNEIDIRMALVMIELKSKSFSLFQTLQETKDYQGVSVIGLYELLIEYEKYHNTIIPDHEFKKLFIYLCVTIYRQKKFLDRRKIMDETQVETILFKQSNYLLEKLCVAFDLEYRSAELTYLACFLSGLSMTTENIHHSTIDPQQVRQILTTVLEEIDLIYFTNFHHNQRLIENLFKHLIPAINRSIYSIQIDNPLLHELKRSFAFSFEISLLIAKRLEDRLSIHLSDKEIGLFTMHIIVALETKVNQNEQSQVAIVCPSGKGMAEFLKVKLHSEIPKLHVVKVMTSSRQLDKLEEEQLDLIVATTEIKNVETPVIYVSPVLKQHDIEKIHDYLNRKEQTEKESLNLLFGYFKEEISIFSKQIPDKDEALRYICCKMEALNYGSSDMYDSVAKRETVSGTEVGNFIAIPHPYPEVIQKNGIGILTTAKPLLWNQEKVQIVLLLCIKPDETREFERIMESIYEISQLPFLVSQLKKVENLSEFKQVIEEGIGNKFH
ncbi:BglG family transcription antiterminator [Enterococcus pallens]|uniref:Uncharacterized protein n=1 Tax=Enterococcus pallens ATCC BAA-351 TaxID=1158607 RepID=R2QLM8_9ENTE|nr:BglG family transcription antiterminator [Enterococcus pallens]EOH97457.1 hypothetical protein UAU_00125 [Enterococcus pallens ATCC BAA-351]EOU21124.1 hypothetical protein I588_01971 [Enterococcus pallens ATCC BAA-351]OJG80671.1 hypothetical protein RV10_GL004408 [Enterococcus pallens]